MLSRGSTFATVKVCWSDGRVLSRIIEVLGKESEADEAEAGGEAGLGGADGVFQRQV